MFKIKSMIVGLIAGVLLEVIIILIICFVLAKIGIYNKNVGIIVINIGTLISSLLGGFIAGRTAGEKGLIYGIAIGFLSLIIVCIYSWLMFGLSAMTNSIVRYLMLIPSAAIGGILSVLIRSKKQYI